MDARVNSLERVSDVVGRSTRKGAKLEAVGERLLAEAVGVVSHGQLGSKLLESGGETVVSRVV